MKISIALCTYNGAAYLAELLASIANQTRQPDELIVCDDVSTDHTVQIVADFATEVDFPVRIVSNEINLGSTRNFEKAIRLCTGDMIALADQDDIWHSCKLERFEQTLIANPDAGLVCSDLVIVDADANATGDTMWQQIGLTDPIRHRLQELETFKVLLKKNYITGSAMAFRTAYRERVLPIAPLWVHDGWIAIIIATLAPLALITHPTVDYRQHDANQIGAYQQPYWRRALHALAIPQSEYEKKLQAFVDLKTHLKTLQNVDAKYFALLDEKIFHFEKRANLPKSFFRRLSLVMSELLCGNYHTFSIHGFSSAIRDILAI